MADVFAGDHSGNEADPLADLVGEGKKFKDVAALARGKAEADAYIARLEAEKRDLEGDLGKRVDTEKELDKLRSELQALKGANPQASKDNTSPALTAEGVAQLVEQTITRTEQNRTVQQNVQKANDAMISHFGDQAKAAEAVRAKAAELNLSVKDLEAMAGKSPTAFQKIMLGDATPKTGDPLTPKSAVREAVDNLAGGDKPREGTKAFYDNLRKADPKRYWTPQVQEEIFKAAKAGTYLP